MKELLSRFKSPVVITSVLSLSLLLLTNLGVIHISGEQTQEIINAILTILIAFGIVNNPTDRDEF